jgi:threonine aldolase
MLGGGMRQAGVIAAAGLYALEHNVQRLAEDHENAANLSRGLAAIEGLSVTTPQTNIFYVDMPAAACEPLRAALARERIRASIGPHTRLVTHLDVSAGDVARTIAAFKAFFKDWRA